MQTSDRGGRTLKLAVCILTSHQTCKRYLPTFLFRYLLPNSLSLTMFNLLIVFFKKIRLLCLACDIFVYHFHLFAEVTSAIFSFAFYGLREVCSSCKKCLRRHFANHCRWQQRAGNRITGCS